MTWFENRSTRESHAIADYWDAQVRQHPAIPVPPAGLPASHGALIRQLHAEEALGSLPDYQDQLLQRLLATYQEDTSMTSVTTAAALPHPQVAQPPLHRPRESTPVSRRRAVTPPSRTVWPLRPAIAIGLVILLVLGSIAGILMMNTGQDEPQRLLAPEVATPGPDASPDIPMYRGNPARTGVFPGPALAGDPVELWRTDVAGQIDSAPAIVDGVMYFGAGDGGVYALDIATGKEVWSVTAASAIDSSPAVSNGLVYVGSEDGTLYALDATNGAEVWTVPGARPASAVAIVDSVLFMGGDDGVYALDAATGATMWKAPLTEPASRATAVADGMVYIGTVDTMLHTFDAATGEPVWSVQLEGSTVGTTAIADGVVYQGVFGGDVNHAYALNAETGDVIWQFTSPDGVGFAPPTIGEDLVYFPGHDSSVYALDRATGEQVWSFATADRVTAAPALVDDTLYVASTDGYLYALDTATGTEQWRLPIEGGGGFGPVITGGAAYIGTGFGYMYAIGGSDTLAAQSLATPDASPVEAPASPAPARPAATPAADQTGPTVTFVWQSTGGPDLLQGPGPIAIAPDGNLWVADLHSDNVQIFSPDGAYIETWGTPGDGPGEIKFRRSLSDPFDSAGSVSFAPDGSFYVVEYANNRVSHFAADRTFISSWGSFGHGDGQFVSPFGGLVAPDGNVYVVDDVRNDIQVFDPEGTYLFTFASHGNGPGQLANTGGFDFDAEGNVHVADFGNNRIVVFSPDGTFLRTVGETGSGEGQFHNPVGVVFDAAGRYYVSDTRNHQIQVFSPDGTFLVAWSFTDDAGNDFVYPAGIVIDSSGAVYVTDNENHSVQKFTITFPGDSGATPVATP